MLCCSGTSRANIGVFRQVADWSENAVKALQDTYDNSEHEAICYDVGVTESKVGIINYISCIY